VFGLRNQVVDGRDVSGMGQDWLKVKVSGVEEDKDAVKKGLFWTCQVKHAGGAVLWAADARGAYIWSQ
jgi:hypothetical protein